MVSSLELSIVVWWRHITSKMLLRIRRNDNISHRPPNTFLKAKSSVLSYNLPHVM